MVCRQCPLTEQRRAPKAGHKVGAPTAAHTPAYSTSEQQSGEPGRARRPELSRRRSRGYGAEVQSRGSTKSCGNLQRPLESRREPPNRSRGHGPGAAQGWTYLTVLELRGEPGLSRSIR